MKYVLFYYNYTYAHLYVETEIYNSIHENLKALEGHSLLKGTLCPKKKKSYVISILTLVYGDYIYRRKQLYLFDRRTHKLATKSDLI